MLLSTRLRRLRKTKGEVCFSYCRIDIASCLFEMGSEFDIGVEAVRRVEVSSV